MRRKAWLQTQRRSGFTLVELIIVIVVVVILATISIVSYNGITAQAKFTAMKHDLSVIHEALMLYKADNGSYPNTGANWRGWDQATGDEFIPGLSPKYIQKIPQLDSALPAEDSFLYISTGSEYQLIRFRTGTIGGLPEIERTNNPRAWFANGAEGWGYWSSGYWSDRATD